MKVSAFAPSDEREGRIHAAVSRLTSAPTVVIVAAGVSLAAHLPWLAPSLEDLDSINFALGLRDFDPASHQPHPPGYPVYIALGRASLAIVTTVFPMLDMVRAEALALAIWSAIGGAVAILAAWFVFDAIGRDAGDGASTTRERTALWATVLLAVSPLFWMTGLRPMSDMPGLAAALVAQAILLRAAQGSGSLTAGAFAMGLAAGLRSQTAVLTLPLLLWAVWNRLRAAQYSPSSIRVLLRASIALVLGGLVWAVPLVASTGGVDGYIRALGSQASEDFGWVNMLWSNPTPRRLAFALYETFALPWAALWLAAIVGVLAALGAVLAFTKERRALVLLCVAFGPYVVFHLLFQDTPFVRYALPVLLPMTWLAARAIAGSSWTFPLAAGLVISSAFVSVPAGAAYGSEAHPAIRAVREMLEQSDRSAPAAVYSHFALFRPLKAGAPGLLNVVPPTRNYEWLGPVEYWRNGGEGTIWFLADPKRTDLALIDPQSRRNPTEYRWRVAERPELMGARPIGADWYRLDLPGWFAPEGWSLTAETGGLVRATRKGLDHRPIEAFVRRRAEPVTVMVGGRYLGLPMGPSAELTLSMDDMAIESWTVDPSASGLNFLRFIRLPGGVPSGPGTYARLSIAARAIAPGEPTPEIAIRQFDLQSDDRPMLGFGEGWHEDEYDVATGSRWRWTSDHSVLRIVSTKPVVLTVRGESPLKYFGTAPTVRFRARDRILAEFRPDRDFEWRVAIPADALADSGGSIVVETDRVYLPAEAEGTSDTRRLGLRVFQCMVD